jgi:hypothetical protein
MIAYLSGLYIVFILIISAQAVASTPTPSITAIRIKKEKTNKAMKNLHYKRIPEF